MAWLRFGSFWIYPLLAFLLLTATVSPGSDRTELYWLVPAGVLTWSLMEYLLHRFFFHLRPLHQKAKRLLRPLHYSHHQDPRNPSKVLVKPHYSLPISALLLAGLYQLMGDLFRASGLLSGIWLGFLYYESVHYRLHQSTRAGGLIGRQRRHHFYHHFVDHGSCFGVTSPLWDKIFGTGPAMDRRAGTTDERSPTPDT